MTPPTRGAPVPAAWRGRVAAYPRAAGVHDIVAEVAARAPDAVAVEDGVTRLTYGELLARAAAMAGALALAGVGPGDRVALVLPRSIELVIAQLAVLAAGGAYVPMEPEDPAERRALLLDECDAAAVLVADDDARDQAGGRPVLTCAEAGRSPPLAPLSRRGGDSPAYLMFTSGSTGRPKGVLVPHRAILRLVLGADYADLGPEQTWLHLAPPAFDAATLEVWAPLLTGGRLVVVPGAMPSLDHLARTIREHRVTSAWLTASLFDVVVDEAPQVLDPLQQLLIGGEALSPGHVRRALQRRPDLRLVNGYGPTENTTFTCCHAITLADTEGPIPIGRPIPNSTALVVDAEGQLVGIGEEGELLAGGDGVALGYVGRPELTAERFLPDPWSDRPGARLYRTGDRVRWREDGVLEFLGRADQQLKIRGHRIEPGEIEAALVALPQVARAAVVSPDRTHLVAWVVPAAPDHPPQPADLAAALAERLPAWMVPGRIRLAAELPLLATGKVDRRRLAEDAAQPDSPPEAGPLGAALAGLVPTGRLDESFVALGGDSLAALVLSARWDRAPGVRVEPEEILAAGSLGSLLELARARQVEARPESPTPPPPAPRAEGPEQRAATREQTALWLEQQLAWHPAAYNEPFAWRIQGPLDAARLRAALDLLVHRHEALRTRLREGPDGLEQQVHPPHPFPLREEPCRADLVEARLSADADRVFALEREAPCRGLLLRLAEEEHVLLLTFHHAVIDDWSLGMLFAQLGAAYAGRDPGPATPSAAAPTSAEVRPEIREWWRARLAGARLDPGLPEPAVPPSGPAGRVCTFSLAPGPSSAIEARGAAVGATPFAVHLGLFLVLLARLSGRSDLAVGSPWSRRRSLEQQAAVGCLLQTLVLRLDLAPGGNLDGLLARSRDLSLGALAHADIGLSELLALTRAPGDHAALDRIQTVFVHRPAPDPVPDLAGLCTTPIDVPGRPPKFALTFWLDRVAEGYRGRVEIHRAAVQDALAERMAAAYPALVAALVADPTADPLTVPVGLAGGERLPSLSGAGPTPTAAASAPNPAPEREVAGVDNLCQLFAEVLGVPRVGPDDDFFELGGDSIAAITLLARVQRRLGVEVGVRQVFEAPTPRAFALRVALVEPVDDEGSVLLRPGLGHPLFCVGQPFLFHRLAPLLHGPRPLVGLDLPAPTGDTATRSIESLAEALVSKVEAWQPTGPVALAGYSVSGNVVFEMANQLLARGRELVPPVVIDAYAPGAARAGAAHKRLARYLGNAARQGPAQVRRVVVRGARRRLRWLGDALREARGQALPRREDPAGAYDAHLRRALLAVREWTPSPLEADLVFVRAAQPHVSFEVLEQDGGWPPLVRGKVEIHELDCSHQDIFEPHNLARLAAVLDQVVSG